ncbi:MAG: hypothetical protein U0172_05150 [Nitrospiraceae bacterium]
MYRRNISHILASIGLGLVLFVLYHSWLKPQYFPPSHTAIPTTLPLEPSTAPQAPPPPSQEPIIEADRTEQRPQQRMVPTGDPPATRYNNDLKAIHEQIERHELSRTKALLTALPPQALDDKTVRRYVASLWNNLGIQQEATSGTVAAIGSYQEAFKLDNTNNIAMLNLAHAYWEQRDPRLTQQFLNDLIGRLPKEPFPHLALADVLLETDRLDEASKHMEMATARAKQDPNVRSYLAAVSERLKHASETEKKFSSQATTHFVVKYDGEEDQSTWMAVLDILEDAYREIGQKLSYQPTKPIFVILHTRDKFQGATGSPAWADGLYDGSLGRIQIPTQGALTDKTWLTRVLRHEFVHALLHEQLGSEAHKLPTWLNEGLAMQLAGDAWPDLDQVLSTVHVGEVTLAPLDRLEGAWGGLPSEAASLAYLEGNSATGYLIDRFGMETVREILAGIKNKQPIKVAIQEKLFMPYEQFQQQWIDTLNDKLSAAKQESH